MKFWSLGQNITDGNIVVKKVDKVPNAEIEKAERIRKEYFEQSIMETKNKKMKMMTFDPLKDRDIGKIGTPERDKYDSIFIKYRNRK